MIIRVSEEDVPTRRLSGSDLLFVRETPRYRQEKPAKVKQRGKLRDLDA